MIVASGAVESSGMKFMRLNRESNIIWVHAVDPNPAQSRNVLRIGLSDLSIGVLQCKGQFSSPAPRRRGMCRADGWLLLISCYSRHRG